MGFFGFGKKNKEKEQEKMKTGLEKTRTGFWGNILNTLTGSVIDDDMYDELEEQLILADVGGEVAVRLVDKLRDRVHEKGLKTGEEAADALRDIIAEEMTPDAEMDLSGKPAVILVIGVNGVGKTTSIAKLADHYTREGKKVMLAAGDTFRAAASEQLEIWADRAGVPIVSAGEGADPAAVIFDTVKSATARGYDMVIADTAGRLHNKANLMAELSKISRSVKKASPEASLETLLVLDAITGQNAISQAKEFCKAADATGIILTKLHRQGRLRGSGQAASGPAGALHRRGRGHRRPAALYPGGLCGRAAPAPVEALKQNPLTVPSACSGAETELSQRGEL
jgi:fused signal recognition particle receptor